MTSRLDWLGENLGKIQIAEPVGSAVFFFISQEVLG
jgi:hypothetical protein